MAVYLSRRIIKPVYMLNEIISGIVEGHYSFFEWENSYRELNRMADNFTSMIKAVTMREEEINSLRKHLTLLVDSMPSIIIGIDHEFCVTLWNKKIIEITGISTEDAVGETIYKVFPFIRTYKETIVKCLYHQEIITFNKVKSSELELGIYLDIIFFPLASESKKEIGMRIDDISSLVNQELLIQQTDKLLSLGNLSAGISHDINNMLTPILGYGELLGMQFDSDSKNYSYTEKIVESVERVQNLVRQLLVFSKKQQFEYKKIDINSLLNSFQKLISHTIPENIKISYKLDKKIPYINGDEGQLEQVLMNLVINARDAMPDGGSLAISTKILFLENPLQPNWNWSGPGAYVCLSVSDEGVGIDTDNYLRVFEPFYSTKGSKGTGLGLSMVYGIIEQHKGYILLNSEVGVGTEFRIYFPEADSRNTIAKKKSLNHYLQGNGETILLVEDEDLVRDMLCTFLKNNGYNVLDAPDGNYAVEMYLSKIESINLLITDVIMPGISGKDLSILFRNEFSDLPVLFISGYSDNKLTQDDWQNKNSMFLEKPFKMDTLLKIVKQLI